MAEINHALHAEGMKKLKALQSRLNELDRRKAQLPIEDYIRERSIIIGHIESTKSRYKLNKKKKHND